MRANLIIFILVLMANIFSCQKKSKTQKQQIKKIDKSVTAADILGNKDYSAICYGGYRERFRSVQPSISQFKDDMKILSAMGIKIVRTYNVQLNLPHTSNLLEAIHQLKQEDKNFEMYVMLGAWIDCLNAWTDKEPNHNLESENNAGEIDRAVALANKYPDIVKIIAVGNEAMVKWATSYYVKPSIILKWVNYLQDLKKIGVLSSNLWITSSDDFSSWGGGSSEYHVKDLEELIKAVDYISMHTYPYHNSHYNSAFWEIPENQNHLTHIQKVDAAMMRSLEFAKSQYNNVKNYMKSLGINKPIHIGETGWATTSNGYYGADGSGASDEYKQSLYYKSIREWTNRAGISCFYFEAFDEQWKDAENQLGSENHFGLISLKGEAKYALWNLVDKGDFYGLTRDGNPISKSFSGDKSAVIKSVLLPNVNYPKN